MRLFALILILLISGCGVSYKAPSAEIKLEFKSIISMDAASLAIQNKLHEWEFEVEPSAIEEKLYAVYSDDPAQPSEVLSFWRHQSKPKKLDLHGNIVTFTGAARDGNLSIASQNERQKDLYPHIAIKLVEYRAGGFSAEGHRIYLDIINFVRKNDYNYIVVSEPPPTDQWAHIRFVILGSLSFGFWWLFTWAGTTAILGAIVVWGLQKLGCGNQVCRAGLISVSALFATPIPVPTMFVILFLPNVLVLMGGLSFYTEIGNEFGYVLVGGFVASLFLSTIAAVVLIRAGKNEVGSESN